MISQFPPEFFRRIDESDDELFYLVPRFVVHIDQAAIRALGQIYLSRLPASGAILDLMSSWRSHLPSGRTTSALWASDSTDPRKTIRQSRSCRP
jgi:hypothetical protein